MYHLQKALMRADGGLKVWYGRSVDASNITAISLTQCAGLEQ